MKEDEKIKRILWHEFGHLCVDEFNISNLHISKENNDSNYWSGDVTMTPVVSFDEIPQRSSLMAYSLISLYSGCVFETISFQKILKSKNKTINDCFSYNDLQKDIETQFNGVTNFMSKLEAAINEETLKIEKDFENSESHYPYIYTYQGEVLQSLISKVDELMEDCGFNEVIEKLHNDFIEKFELFIEKYHRI